MPRCRIAVLAAALAALALPGVAEAKFRQFKMPSNNIGCAYYSSEGPGPYLRCDVLSLGDNGGFFLRKKGKAKRHHITDTAFNPDARVLKYGKTRKFGPFTCKSRRSGLTCKSRKSGHGFKLSRERQKLF